MTSTPQSTNEWIDNFILELAHVATMLPRGKTISAATFPEAKEELAARIAAERAAAEKAGYERGYNTGWQKSRRTHNMRYRLNNTANQMDELSKTLRELAALTPQQGSSPGDGGKG